MDGVTSDLAKLMTFSMLTGRVAGLAIALGIGALLASVPWSAAADTADTSGLDLATLDSPISALLPAVDTDSSGLICPCRSTAKL